MTDAQIPEIPNDDDRVLHIDAPGYQGPDRRHELRVWREEVDARLHDGAATMRHLRKELAENTTATKQVQSDTSELVSLLNSFKGAMVVLDKLGKLAKPLGYIVVLVTSVVGFVSALKGGAK